jgi:hypothetical protein
VQRFGASFELLELFVLVPNGLDGWTTASIVAEEYFDASLSDLGLRLTFDGSHLAAGTYYIRAQNAIMGGRVKLQVVH